MDVQRYLARLIPIAMLNARNGLDYPMTPAEMTEQLVCFPFDRADHGGVGTPALD